jgi:hypothetical protein
MDITYIHLGVFKGAIDNRGSKHPLYGIKLSEYRKLKISESEKGKIVSEEICIKISNSNKGRKVWNKGIPMSIDQKEKLRIANLGREGYWKGKHLSEITRLKISDKLKNKKLSNRHKEKIKITTNDPGFRKNISERMSKKVSCPHCGKIGSLGPMKQWHFDNCNKKDKS